MPRQQTHEIVIDAPIEAVWKAISDGEESLTLSRHDAAIVRTLPLEASGKADLYIVRLAKV